MADAVENDENGVVSLAAEIVCAYVTHNSLSTNDLAKLIADVHSALSALGAHALIEAPRELIPAVSIRKSVTQPG